MQVIPLGRGLLAGRQDFYEFLGLCAAAEGTVYVWKFLRRVVLICNEYCESTGWDYLCHVLNDTFSKIDILIT